MTDEHKLINRVANSGLVNFNLEHHYPQNEFATFDLKDHLFHGLILKEKDFRQALKEVDWSIYNEKILLVICSVDAVIPVWAYMLVSAYAEEFATDIFQGDKSEYLKHHYQKLIDNIDGEKYTQERVVIKGCSEKEVPPSAYAALTRKLKPFAQSIMYGEPCSTVPIFKRPRILKKA